MELLVSIVNKARRIYMCVYIYIMGVLHGMMCLGVIGSILVCLCMDQLKFIYKVYKIFHKYH